MSALFDFRPHLSRPARVLFRHNLTGVLESAIRSSNSQFDDADILRRLDIDLLEHTASEVGWDSFCLNYHTDSPINSLISKSCIKNYSKIFCLLWKVKRVEYALSCSWALNMRQTRFSNIPHVAVDLHRCRLVCSEMIHFIYQLQYYFQFDVIECSWAELSKAVNSECDYDYSSLIRYHQEFLTSLKSKAFLEPKAFLL